MKETLETELNLLSKYNLNMIYYQENLRDVVFFPMMRGPGDTSSAHSRQLEDATQSIEMPFHRDEALLLLDEHCRDEWLRAHLMATEAIMRSLASELEENEEVWGLTGLLHDLDFEETQADMARHGLVTAEILRARETPEPMIHAILAHNGENLGVEGSSRLDHALSAAEQITGLIVAAAKVLPDKRIASLKLKSVRKRMKEPAFARRVDRQRIKDCEKIGLTLDRFIEISLEAMTALEVASSEGDGTPSS